MDLRGKVTNFVSRKSHDVFVKFADKNLDH